MEISKLYFFLTLLLCCSPSCCVTTFLNHHSSLPLSLCLCYASAPGDTSSSSTAQILKIWLYLYLFCGDCYFSSMVFLPSLDLPSDTHIIFSYILTYTYFSFHNNVFFLQTKLQFFGEQGWYLVSWPRSVS